MMQRQEIVVIDFQLKQPQAMVQAPFLLLHQQAELECVTIRLETCLRAKRLVCCLDRFGINRLRAGTQCDEGGEEKQRSHVDHPFQFDVN